MQVAEWSAHNWEQARSFFECLPQSQVEVVQWDQSDGMGTLLPCAPSKDKILDLIKSIFLMHVVAHGASDSTQLLEFILADCINRKSKYLRNEVNGSNKMLFWQKSQSI